MELLGTAVLGNTIKAWLISALLAVVVFIVLKYGVRVARRRLDAIAKRTETRVDDVLAATLASTRVLLLLLFAAFIATLPLQFTPQVQGVISSVALLALLIQVGLWSGTALRAGMREYAEQRLNEDPAALTTMNAMGFVARLALWSVILLLALDNLGIDITTLVTGLGIGGIAVALAAQNILGDLFASLTIVLDKPFVIKDFLVVNEFLGSVEYIGLKTTRLRSLSGEQLVFSNSDLLNSRIRNYGRMFERRVVFSIGVVYQTPRDKLKEIPEIIRSAIETQEKTRFDRAHFKEFGAYSLNFEAVYYVLDSVYNFYMDTQQAINFFIHERFEAEGIEFAYPSQTLFVSEAQSLPNSLTPSNAETPSP